MSNSSFYKFCLSFKTNTDKQGKGLIKLQLASMLLCSQRFLFNLNLFTQFKFAKTMKTTTINQLEKLLAKSTYDNFSFTEDFNTIIQSSIEGYAGTLKEQLKSYLEDMRHGCQSGMVSEFIYHSDCKAFYIKHIDDLETFKQDFEECLGNPIENNQKLPHYTFMCWLCFEEYCNNIYRQLFEN